jgi:hypothetical protein
MLIDLVDKPSYIHQKEVIIALNMNFIEFIFLFIVFILPPLINYYGKVFSVAELVASRYATFLPTGAVMSRYYNIANYVQANASQYFIS